MKNFALCSSGVYPNCTVIVFNTKIERESEAMASWDLLEEFETIKEARKAENDFYDQQMEDQNNF